MGRLTGSKKPINFKEASGTAKKTKKRQIEEDNKKLAENAAQYFKKQKLDASTDIAGTCSIAEINSIQTDNQVPPLEPEKIQEELSTLQPNDPVSTVSNLMKPTSANSDPSGILNPVVEQEEKQPLDNSDPSTWDFPLSEKSRQTLLKIGPKQLKINSYQEILGYRFSQKDYIGQKKNEENYNRDWLLYSVTSNSLFCFPCCIFGMHKIQSPWINYGKENLGFSDFKNKARVISMHEQSHSHFECIRIWKCFNSNLKKGSTVNTLNENVIMSEISFWRSVLTAILDAIMFLARNNLAFRGVSDNIKDTNCGNFLNLVKLLSKYHAPLATHLDRLERNSTSYLSHEIQNEFINICGGFVRQNILAKIRERKYYSILFDSTPDSSHKEQVSQVIRTVSCSKLECKVEEHFVDFVSTTEKTGLGLSEVIVKKIGADGLNISDCRGQGYDNGSNMAGIYSGVQKRINDINPHANYIPCAAHSLNLVGVNAADKILPAKLILGQIQNLYNFFVGSSKRWEVLRQKVKITLKCESKTRWSAKANAVSALNSQFEDIVEVLTEISISKEFNAETTADANSRLNEMLSFKFLLGLIVWDNVLFKIEVCNRAVQNQSFDIERANKLLSGLINWLKEFRNTGFEMCYAKAKEKGNSLGIDETQGFNNVRQTRGKKRTRLEEKSDDASLSNIKRFEVEFFNELIDKLLSEMTSRFEKIKEFTDLFGFMWGKKLETLSQLEQEQHVKDLALAYEHDFDAVHFINEIKFLKDAVVPFLDETKKQKLSDTGPLDILSILHSNEMQGSFPNIETGLRIFLTLPVTVASNERVFSKLKIIKNYLRSSMGQERLSNLAILSIEQETTKDLSFDVLLMSLQLQSAVKCLFLSNSLMF